MFVYTLFIITTITHFSYQYCTIQTQHYLVIYLVGERNVISAGHNEAVVCGYEPRLIKTLLYLFK